MLKSAKTQMLLVLAVGAAIGYAAASGKLGQFQNAEATPTGGSAVVEKVGGPPSPGVVTPPCCPSGASNGQILAMADPVVVAQAQGRLAARAQANGKKPNIVFIMGDDVGWFNIGAYHQGI